MQPPTWVQHLAETEQIAFIRAATVMEHEQTNGITLRRPLLEGQGAHACILLARLARTAASQDCSAVDTARKSAFRL